MLGTCASPHNSSVVGALFKRTYLFILIFGIVYLFYDTSNAQSDQSPTYSLHGEVIDEQSRERLKGLLSTSQHLRRALGLTQTVSFSLMQCRKDSTHFSSRKPTINNLNRWLM